MGRCSAVRRAPAGLGTAAPVRGQGEGPDFAGHCAILVPRGIMPSRRTSMTHRGKL